LNVGVKIHGAETCYLGVMIHSAEIKSFQKERICEILSSKGPKKEKKVA
jgi:hypothetical protein